MTEPGEVAYQELTITTKDVVTGKVTTLTGTVKNFDIVMITEQPPGNMDIAWDHPRGITVEKKTIRVYLAGEWVPRHDRHFLMTILDEIPPEVWEKDDVRGSGTDVVDDGRDTSG